MSLPPVTCKSASVFYSYRNDPKFSDRYAWANSADPDQEQSDQGLHCLPFRQHRLNSLLYGRATSLNFRVITTNFLGVRIFRKFTVSIDQDEDQNQVRLEQNSCWLGICSSNYFHALL